MEDWILRPIQPQDNPAMAAIIRQVMPEFGADGPGFAIHDAEVDTLCEAYARPGAAYFVIECQGRVVGGAGIAPLEGGPEGVCELKKMYFLPEARGRGWGDAAIRRCLEAAVAAGYRTCYLETMRCMEAAMRLYRKMGFIPLDAPLGCTGHFGCDRWFARDLEQP